MNKKKVLIVIPEYSHGGTNKCLENLLLYMDFRKYHIYIYCLYEDGGQYYKEIFKPYIIKKSKLYNYAHDNFYTRKICGFWHKVNKEANFSWLYKKEAKWLQDKFNFDVVIGYQEGSATEFASYFENVKKIAWFHSPYMDFIKNDLNYNYRLYNNFDKIVCVSYTFSKLFTSILNLPVDKVIGIHNILDIDNIKEKSHETQDEVPYDRTFNIISIGRFAKQKRFDIIPYIAYEIIKKGIIKFKWYIIGSGEQTKELVIEQINHYNVKDHVIILGEKDNPYPYIKISKIMVCTSETENYPTIINESKALHVPVVTNNYISAQEIVNSDCGWVCSLDEMPDLLVEIINDEGGIYTKMKESISSYEYSNDDIIRKVEKLLDN